MSEIKVRVGARNANKVVSSISGGGDTLAGLSDDSASIERLARRLGEQQVNVARRPI